MSLKVENKSDEFVLYMVHESGGEPSLSLPRCRGEEGARWGYLVSPPCDVQERTRLRDDEHPLVTRVLHGPCEKISKILITEADLGEEVTYDVRLRLCYSIFLHVLGRIDFFFLFPGTNCFDKKNMVASENKPTCSHVVSWISSFKKSNLLYKGTFIWVPWA